MAFKNNPFDLTGRNIVITGAGGLMGRRFAYSLSEFGANLILLDINERSIKELADRLNQNFATKVSCFVTDITDEDQVRNSVQLSLNSHGSVDGLINNAARNPAVGVNGLSSLGRLENLDLGDWNADLAIGLTGAFLCSKHFGQAMSRNQTGGIIVNISSDLGLISPDQRIYSTTKTPVDERPVKPVSYSVVKSGLLGLTRYLATYWPGVIRCNAICPGGIETDQNQEFIDELAHRIPMGRMAKLDEYGATIVYLLSNASSYLNGAIIPIDGGRTAW
jgi:NAD(P)-dependent dehydrogenase (short-subunit alcohol dehydrogenase family)